MKKYIIFLAIASIIIVPLAVSAQMGMMPGGIMSGNWNGGQIDLNSAEAVSLNASLQNIYDSQNITSQAQIDCSKVTDQQFEEMGDDYMGVMLPNQQQHKAMDNMMGGEGSASLALAHINMGRSYLGCWSNYNSGPIGMPVMSGYGMMDNWSGNSGYGYNMNNMMGYGTMMFGGMGWFGTITMLLVWALLILGIVAAIKYLKNKN